MAYKRKSNLPKPKKAWGGAISGAGSGAAVGTMLAPGVGTLIGTGAGAIAGGLNELFGNRKRRRLERRLAKQNKALLAKQDAYRKEAQQASRVATVRADYQTDEDILADNELVNDTDLYMAKGGRLNKHTLPNKNSRKLSNGAELLVNNSGSTTGSHENGDNIPIKKGNEIVAYAEPGEVVVDDVVLSKRLGFADKYLQLEEMKQDIIKEQKMLPKHNAKLANKLIPMGRRKPLAPTGLDLMNIGSAAGTVGNLISSNQALNAQSRSIRRNAAFQKKLTEREMAMYAAYRPTLSKARMYNTNIDVSDVTSEINRGYSTSVSGLDQVDPATASAIKNAANTNRITQLSKIYGERNRLQRDIKNRNVDIIRNTETSNAAQLDAATQYRTSGLSKGLSQLGDINNQTTSALIGIEGQRVSNIQGAISEFNTILNDRLMIESVSQRYANELGDRGLPKSMREIRFRNRNDRAFDRGELMLNNLTGKYEPLKYKSNGGKLPRKKRTLTR